jgi:hypothetical protein
MRALKVLGTGVFVALGLLVASACFLFFWPRPDFHPTSFSATGWKRALGKNAKDLRLSMVDDLLERHVLTGKRRSEVVSLLGEPDTTGYFKEFDMVYYLGPQRVGLDSEWLVLRTDDNVVQEVRVLTD